MSTSPSAASSHASPPHHNHHLPRWLLALILAGMSAIGALSIDAYMPAFGGIAADMQVGMLEMQQTLSAYLMAFSVMFLFHGSLSDSYGRKPVMVISLIIFCLSSIGCALSQSIGQLLFFRMLQGASSGAGSVVARAMIRDMFNETDAQKLMSLVTLWFGIAPVVGPIVGGVLFTTLGWRSVFWFIVLFSAVLIVLSQVFLRETLAASHRHRFHPVPLLQGYWALGSSPSFLLLCAIPAFALNGFFLYIASAPAYLVEHLHVKPTQFAWLFVPLVSGVMTGAYISGRIAGKWSRHKTLKTSFIIMALASIVNVAGNYLWSPVLPWAVIPMYCFATGLFMAMPALSIMAMDMFPTRRGMAASLQTFIVGIGNTLTAGVLSPALSHHPLWLAGGMFGLMLAGLLSWLVFQRFCKSV